MASMTVDRKVMAGGLGGALALVLVWVLEESLAREVPTYVAMALQTIGVFVTQYFVPNKEVPSE